MARRNRWYLYFAERTRGGLIKIGMTGNPRVRLRQLRRQYGDDLGYITYCDSGPAVESGFHFAFRDQREYGEWFRPCQRLEVVMDYIAEHERIPWGIVTGNHELEGSL